MIADYFDFLEGLARNEPFAREVEVLKRGASAESGYIRMVVTFTDGSQLHAFEHVDADLDRNDYSYHWQDEAGELRIRWDSAPHHEEVDTFPHHVHRGDSVEPSEEPSLAEVLRTIHREM